MSCITQILKLKGDKEFFVPEGSFHAIEGGGVYRDYEYLVTLVPHGGRCGYVAIPPHHEYSNLKENDYDAPNIECHGCITFVSKEHSLKDYLTIPCSDMWIGFDCSHYGDSPDKVNAVKYFGKEVDSELFWFGQHFEKLISSCDEDVGEVCKIRDYSYVENECKSIIDQLISLEN